MIIHHYTSIQTLALILKHRAIRFNRLDKVDDVEEISGLPRRFGTYLFVSCWTEEETENIALWAMYTSMNGVRISLPKEKIFKTYPIKPGQHGPYVVHQDVECLLPPQRWHTEKYFLKTGVLDKSFYKPIEFTADYKEKDEKTFQEEGNNLNIRGYEMLGGYKDEIWDFQRESRFTLTIMPLLPLDDPRINQDWGRHMVSSTMAYRDGKEAPIECFFLTFMKVLWMK